MLKFQFVEDYIETLSGFDLTTSSKVLYNNNRNRYSLARYDVKIVESMANATVFGAQGLTDLQGELAIKLVLKYRKQFANNGIDISPIESNPQFRMPLRKIDRSQKIWIEDGSILVKFPFNQNWIDDLRGLKEANQGRAEWKYNQKVWQLGITEYMINFVASWGQKYQFEISPDVIDLFNKVIDCENTPYEIKLVRTQTGYDITNAEPSLRDYVSEHIGDDFVKLIDHAGILGYTVDADLLEQASNKYGQALEYIGTKQNVYLDPTPELADWIFDYAELTDRYPICIYDPTEKNIIDLGRFDERDIVRFDQNGKTDSSDYNPYGVKIVYAKKLPKTWDFPVPLLVSTQQMMYGGRRLDWLNRAEKIVYFCRNMRDRN